MCVSGFSSEKTRYGQPETHTHTHIYIYVYIYIYIFFFFFFFFGGGGLAILPVCTLQPIHGNWAYSEDPDQSLKTLHLIRVFTVCIQDFLFNIK